jgi:hypothetical protein
MLVHRSGAVLLTQLVRHFQNVLSGQVLEMYVAPSVMATTPLVQHASSPATLLA